MEQTAYKIIANKDGSNAHAVSWYPDNPVWSRTPAARVCSGWNDQPVRLGYTEVTTLVGEERVARYYEQGVALCEVCRRVATSLAATQAAEDALCVAAKALIEQGPSGAVTLHPADLAALLAAVVPLDADTLDYDPTEDATGGGNGFIFRRYTERTGRPVEQPVRS